MQINLLVVISSLTLISQPAFAHHQSVHETCHRYRYSEEYIPGYTTPEGIYVQGRIKQSNIQLPCNSYQVHNPHYTTPHYPQQQQSQAVAITPPTSQAKSCDGIARMGISTLAGGLAGRYLGGGVKSPNTVRNTTIGAVGGFVVGSLLPC